MKTLGGFEDCGANETFCAVELDGAGSVLGGPLDDRVFVLMGIVRTLQLSLLIDFER